MRPKDAGLPPKFKAWRPGQWDAITHALCADTRFTILNMPTGTGKSPTYVAIANIVGGRALALTHTKGLQDQAMTDFKPIGMRQIKGQMNYPCIMLEDEVDRKGNSPGCDEGPCHAGTECEWREGGCYYYDAVRKAERARLVITNYSYWMHLNRYAEPEALGTFDTLILDEAHEAVDLLSDFVRVRLERRVIKRHLKLDMPRSTHIEEWVDWADYALRETRKYLKAAKAGSGLYRKYVGVVRTLVEIEASLVDILAARDWRRTDVPDPVACIPGKSNDWVIEDDDEGVTFQPVWPIAYARKYLFAGIKRIIFVSATVTTKDVNYLGVGNAALTYRSFTSPFHRDNRPVFYVPTARIGRNTTPAEERIWLERIDQIIEKELGEKGIIHTVSYERARLIQAHSKFSDLMIVHGPRETREAVQDFKNAAPPSILVSPAVSTGYDFPDDEARWQIIAKIPFVDNRPRIMQARAKSDKNYLNYIALVSLIQMCGRPVRGGTDWARTYIVDDNWRWFSSATRLMMPAWFRASLKRLNGRLRPA